MDLYAQVEWLRGQAATDPETYTVELAGALINLGLALARAGETVHGLATLLEARDLFKNAPTPGWLARAGQATASYNMAHLLVMQGQPQPAERWAEESVRIRRELAEADPAEHLADYAISLGVCGIIQIELKRPAEAMPRFLESVEIMRGLTESDPQKHMPGMIAVMQWMGEGLREFPAPSPELQALIERLSQLGRGITQMRTGHFDAALMTISLNANPGEMRARMPPQP